MQHNHMEMRIWQKTELEVNSRYVVKQMLTAKQPQSSYTPQASIYLKIQHGISRHIEFQKMLLFPILIKIFQSNWVRIEKIHQRHTKITMWSKMELRVNPCDAVSEMSRMKMCQSQGYDGYFNHIWGRAQAPPTIMVECAKFS